MRSCSRIFSGLVFALLVLFVPASNAQRYTFTQYVEGLGNLNVKCLYQDRTGFLWVGTHGGLFRYDGYRFEEFAPKDGLTTPMIEDIYEDPAGRLWVASPNGLFVRSGRRFTNVLLNGQPLSTLSFEILPPWWKSRPFYGVVCIALPASVFITWRWSNRLIIARQNRLKAPVKERTRALEAEKAELLSARAALVEQASRDFLTGLLNRGAIFGVLQQEMERAKREQYSFAAVFVDLDHFKRVNDTYGHLVGDDVLREFARRIAANLRPYDQVGRFGGEELLILMPGLSSDSEARIHELHRKISQEPYVVGKLVLPITCSFGVAWFNSEMDTAESLLNLADQALCAAKANGRNRVEVANPQFTQA